MPSGKSLGGPWLHSYQGQLIDPRVTIAAGRRFANGFFVREWRDVVVTAAHVISGVGTACVVARGQDGSEVWFRAQAAAFDEARDLALLRLPNSVKGFVEPLRVDSQLHNTAPRLMLIGYADARAWRRLAITRWPPVSAQAHGGWLDYVDGSPGGHGFSGSAVVDVSSNVVVGVHHGAPGLGSNRAARLDLDLIHDLRARAYEIS